jgi:hypothetical protein
LNRRCDQVVVTAQASHSKHVRNVVPAESISNEEVNLGNILTS